MKQQCWKSWPVAVPCICLQPTHTLEKGGRGCVRSQAGTGSLSTELQTSGPWARDPSGPSHGALYTATLQLSTGTNHTAGGLHSMEHFLKGTSPGSDGTCYQCWCVCLPVFIFHSAAAFFLDVFYFGASVTFSVIGIPLSFFVCIDKIQQANKLQAAKAAQPL